MTILLVFNNADIIQIFRFEDPDPTLLQTLRECHGVYLNTRDDSFSSRAIEFLKSLSDPIFDESATYRETIKVSGDSEIIVCGSI